MCERGLRVLASCNRSHTLLLARVQLFRERQHVGGWLGVGEDLPVPVTSGPPQFTSNDYAPTNLVDAPDRSSGEMRFRSVRGSTTEPAALLPEPASSEGPFGGSDPRGLCARSRFLAVCERLTVSCLCACRCSSFAARCASCPSGAAGARTL
jgi:hypothetical protein